MRSAFLISSPSCQLDLIVGRLLAAAVYLLTSAVACVRYGASKRAPYGCGVRHGEGRYVLFCGESFLDVRISLW